MPSLRATLSSEDFWDKVENVLCVIGVVGGFLLAACMVALSQQT